MPTRLPVLEVDAAHIDEACVVRVRGELDIAGCPSLERALRSAELTKAERLILDLEKLEFIDARGLHTLVAAARRSARNGNRLEVTRGSGQVARIMKITKVGPLLPLTDPCMCPAILDPPRLGSHRRRANSRGSAGRRSGPVTRLSRGFAPHLAVVPSA